MLVREDVIPTADEPLLRSDLMVSGGIQAFAHSPVVQQRQVKIGSGPVRRELQRTWHILADGESVTPLARPHAAAMVVWWYSVTKVMVLPINW